MDSARLAEIDAVFDAALDLEPAGRSAFLDRRCGADTALRREVESLLERAGRSTATFEEPLRRFVGTVVPETAEPLAVGATIGAWRVVRPLGRGGMGVVALAERVDGTFEHQVAIKVLPHAVSSPEAVRRFELERQILARLSHPNIAHLVDGGVDARGLPYLVMEHVEGQPVDAHCDALRLDVDSRLRIVVAVARAVHAAHRALVVHRDIKPSNVLVGADGVVKLLDFGIAKLVDPDPGFGAGSGAALTITAAHVLTPAYASPEQVRGEPITTAADIYQLGLLAYELLTGRRAQPTSTSSLAELVRVVCEQEAMPPSRRVAGDGRSDAGAIELASRLGSSPARLARRYRGDLDAVVGRALDKDPERRYGSAEELAADLERHLAGRPVRARRATLGYRARKFVRRNAAASAVAALAIVLTVGYAIAVTVQARAIAQARERAELEAQKAQEVERFILGLFEVAHPGNSQGREVTVAELLQPGVERIDKELSGEPEVQARMLSTLGHVQAGLGRLDEAIVLQRRSLVLRRELFGGDHLEVAESAGRLGQVLRRKGLLDEAESLLEEALATERRLRPASPELARVLGELGMVHYQRGDYPRAEAAFTEALALQRAAGNLGGVASGLNSLGLVVVGRGDFTGAIPLFREAIALSRQVYGERHGALSDMLANLGRAYQGNEDPVAAQPLFEEAVAIDREVFGEDHPEFGVDLTLLASNLTRLGQPDRAEPLVEEALRVLRARLEPGHPRIATATFTLGQVRLAQGRLTEAEAEMRSAIAMRRTLYGDSHPLIAYAQLFLGRCLAAAGRVDEAVAVWHEALPMTVGGRQAKLEGKLRAELAKVEPTGSP